VLDGHLVAGGRTTLQPTSVSILILQKRHGPVSEKRGNAMADEHTVTTPVERQSESHDVLFQDELAILLRVSRATIERRRRDGTFPIPELPGIDNRPRWSRMAVEQYLSSTRDGLTWRRRAVSRR
jgi:hypothetical protein